MRRFIFVVTALLLLVSTIPTMPKVSAMSGGILDGVLGATTSGSITNPSYLTDGVLGTSTSFSSGANMRFDLGGKATITGIYVRASGYASSGNYVINFYSSTNALLRTFALNTASRVEGLTSQSGLTGVRYINIYTSTSWTVNEFDIYGTVVKPPIPTGVSGVAGNTSVDLSWVSSSDPSIVGYNIYQDGVKVNSTPVVEPTYSISGLVTNQTYEFRLSSVDIDGLESSLSNAILLTPTPPVLNFDAVKGVNSLSSNVSLINYETQKTFNLHLLLPYGYGGFMP